MKLDIILEENRVLKEKVFYQSFLKQSITLKSKFDCLASNFVDFFVNVLIYVREYIFKVSIEIEIHVMIYVN